MSISIFITIRESVSCSIPTRLSAVVHSSLVLGEFPQSLFFTHVNVYAGTKDVIASSWLLANVFDLEIRGFTELINVRAANGP